MEFDFEVDQLERLQTSWVLFTETWFRMPQLYVLPELQMGT